MEALLQFFKTESTLFGGDDNAHLVSVLSTLATIAYYVGYYVVSRCLRRRIVLRNPEVERVAYRYGLISPDQLMTKYSGNLSASSTMAALAVTMVLLSVAALFQSDLEPYDNFVAIMVCAMMTIASVDLLFAHELYDCILNPLFEPERRFRLRKLGSNFQAMGLVLFIVSMLLAISTVSTLATLVSSLACCVFMTLYMELRFVRTSDLQSEILQLAGQAGEEGRA